MTNIDFYPLVSEAAQNRYARAVSEYKSAQAELLASWSALVHERYASEQGPPDREEDCSDLG
jgi:hypothetical protein